MADDYIICSFCCFRSLLHLLSTQLNNSHPLLLEQLPLHHNFRTIIMGIYEPEFEQARKGPSLPPNPCEHD